jgi:hypothetical protein
MLNSKPVEITHFSEKRSDVKPASISLGKVNINDFQLLKVLG